MVNSVNGYLGTPVVLCKYTLQGSALSLEPASLTSTRS